MILILSHDEDEHARWVEAELERLGAVYTRLDTRACLEGRAWAHWLSEATAGAWSGEVRGAGGDFALAAVGAVWNRRPRRPRAPDLSDVADREFARLETQNFVEGLWAALSDRAWVNPLEAARRAEVKSVQLAAAVAVGLRCPRTLLTNDPEQALQFVSACPAGAVYKPFTQFNRSSVVDGDNRGVYTSVVTPTDVKRLAASIGCAPCIFQEYVPKAYELRVTVVEETCFPGGIFSQSSEKSKIDWRRYDLPNTPYAPIAVDQQTQERLVALLRSLGLLFGCLDLIVTPDNEIVFLEVNQAGQWGWVEQLTGLRITERLAALLADRDRAYGSA